MSASAILIVNQSPNDLEQEQTMIYRFHHTIILAVVVCLCGVLIEINAGAPMLVAQGGVQADHPTFVDWPFFFLGSLVGGFAIVGFRRLKDTTEAARYFGVSVAGSWLLAPTIVYDFKLFGLVPEPKWHACLAAAGVAAMCAWTILEIATVFFTSCNKAYTDNGIVGLRNHLILIVSIGAIRMSSAEAEAKVMTGQTSISPGQVSTPAQQIAKENPK